MKVIEHFEQPRCTGALERIHGSGEARSPDPGCPDRVRFSVCLDGDRVVGVQQESEGCVATEAGASCLAELMVGLTVDRARGITAEALEEELGGVPSRHRSCLDVPIAALGKALGAIRAVRRGSRDGGMRALKKSFPPREGGY